MYVLLLQDLQRHVATQVTVATMALAAGAQVEMPDEGKIRAEFDEQLRAAPERETDADRLVLMQALGLDPTRRRRRS